MKCVYDKYEMRVVGKTMKSEGEDTLHMFTLFRCPNCLGHCMKKDTMINRNTNLWMKEGENVYEAWQKWTGETLKYDFRQ
jgi:esterase/lipase